MHSSGQRKTERRKERPCKKVHQYKRKKKEKRGPIMHTI